MYIWLSSNIFLYINFVFLHSLNRSHKEKRSSYAPDFGVRYDGIYRIEKCWRKIGIQVILCSLYTDSKRTSRTFAFCSCLSVAFCHRVSSKSAGIFLYAVKTNQLLGPGLIKYIHDFILEKNGTIPPYYLTHCYGFQWWSWWPSKTIAQDRRATRCNWYNREKRTSFMGLWCMHICFFCFHDYWTLFWWVIYLLL